MAAEPVASASTVLDHNDAYSTLEQLEIKDSEELKKYMEIMELRPSSFSRLRILEARKCDQELTKFLSILLHQSPELEELIVETCEMLKQVLDLGELAPDEKEPPLESCEMIEHVIEENGEMQESLFPNLRFLALASLPKLRGIVKQDSLGRTLSFEMLSHLTVCSCNQLRYVLPLHVLQSLGNLQNIEMSDCEMLERVFGDEDDTQMRKSDNIVHQLPQVRSLTLEKLPKFSGCCQDGCMVEWLSLESVRIVKCDMIQNSSLGMIHRPLLTSVEVIECNTWANNEDLESNILCLFHLTEARKLMKEKNEWALKEKIGKEKDLYLEETDGISDVLFQLNSEGFPWVKKLHIQNNTNIEHIVNSPEKDVNSPEKEPISFPKLETMVLENLSNLKAICHGPLTQGSFKELKVINVKSCKRLQYLFFPEIGRLSLRSLTLQHSPALTAFYSHGNVHHVIPTLFPTAKAADIVGLKELKLVSIPRIERLVCWSLADSQHVPLKYLETMEIAECNGLECLFATTGGYIKYEEVESFEGLLCQLRGLCLRDLDSFTSIVDRNSHPRILKFKMLTHLTVRSCKEMKYLLPLYVLEYLQQLKNIDISDCKRLEQVFVDEKDTQKTNSNVMDVLPLLHSLKLNNLPELASIYSGAGYDDISHSLTQMTVENRPKFIFTFADNLSRIEEEQPSKKELKLEALFNGLKHLKVISMRSTMLVVFTHTTLSNNVRAPLQNLETMEIVDCNDLQYLFAIAQKEKKDRKAKAHENYGGLLPDLRQLHLRNLGQLRSIVGLNLPERTLSFKMLNQLIVWSCNQLRYVLPLYVLKNLQQLENIEISDCEMLERIFGDEDDTQMNKSDKIVHQLPQVKSLILEKLPNFSGCCQDGSAVEWLTLERVRVVECPMIQQESLGMIERPLLTSVDVIDCNTWANSEDPEKNIIHLFGLTDELSILEELKIKDSEELRKYMEMKLQPSSFRRLKILEALQCDQDLTRFLSISLLGRSHGLEKLTIENCKLLEQIFDLGDLAPVTQITRIFPNLQTMRLNGLPKLNYICNNDSIISGTAKLGNLVQLEIIDCNFLKGPIPTTLLEKLGTLKIESCTMIEQVVEENVEMQGGLFCNLDDLQLLSLPRLTKFNSGHRNLTIPNLRSLRIEKCAELNAFTSGFLSNQTTNEGTSYHVPPDDKMDACLKLQTLKLVGNKTFEEIWKGNITDCELKEVEVDSFNKLKYIFPPNMLPKLSEKLVTLVVRNCSSLSDVFRLMSGNHSVTAFQNLMIVRLKGCDSLQRLLLPCNYPSLTEIDISDCQNLEDIFIDTKINADEECFPNLKSIVLENLPRLSSFSLEAFEFPKLNKVRIVNCSAIKTFSRNVSVKATNFMDKDSSGNPKESHQLLYDIEEDSPFGHDKTILLPQLQVLELSDLPKMQLWNQEPQIPVFQMLTSLKIIGCGSIECLFSISVAQRLDHLKSLTLYKCENMVQVLKDGSGIASPLVFVFQNLETLVLKRLPKLASFCEELIDFGEFRELKMVRVEDVPNMDTFVKFRHDTPKFKKVYTPKLKEVYVTYVNKYWRGDLNETIKYLHKDHEKLKKEVWKTDQSSPANSLHRYKVAAESSSQGMKRTSWSFEEVETELH